MRAELAQAADASVGLARSPLAPEFPDLPVVSGARFAAANTGIKYKDRDDVLLVALSPGTTIAGVFTKSATRSAAVLDCQTKIASTKPGKAAILVNAGNANAFTGGKGQMSVEALCEAVSDTLSVDASRVFTASTGVIGEPLPHRRIVKKLADLKAGLSGKAMAQAAHAIRTTDTFAKAACTEVNVDGTPVRIAGIAKGSGMIAPDMATMLAYVFTDAAIDQPILQRMVERQVENSFNAITVDSDTSTSDTLIVAATGASEAKVASARSAAGRVFEAALGDVLRDLAHQVVRDGEGATKIVEVTVTGAAGKSDAKRAARAIANSPLVKTAIAGEDPNWGRIVMALGKSGAKADRDKISIWFGDVLVAENGWVSDTYKEQDGAAYMRGQDLLLRIDLGVGNSEARVWTCDLTHGYISINADYRS
ncbi:MAG: bifunctional glutamate N-acetyltransferase/amino-acid acetyltransferase ArgJ [Pseudomonadota bacterium]